MPNGWQRKRHRRNYLYLMRIRMMAITTTVVDGRFEIKAGSSLLLLLSLSEPETGYQLFVKIMYCLLVSRRKGGRGKLLKFNHLINPHEKWGLIKCCCCAGNHSNFFSFACFGLSRRRKASIEEFLMHRLTLVKLKKLGIHKIIEALRFLLANSYVR